MFAFLLMTAMPFLQPTAALSLPKQLQRHIGGASLAAITTLAPLVQPSQAVETVKLDVDFPALIQIAKDNQDVVLNLAKQTASAVKITKVPSSWPARAEFVRDAGAGDAMVVVNGVPFDISLLSEKGGVDVNIATEKGDIAFSVTSELLPKLPLLEKRVVSPEDIAAREAERLAAAVALDNAPKVPLLDRPFFFTFGKGWTNKQVLGTTSLSVGAAYGVSYAYFEKSKADEEALSRKKKEAVAAKRAAAAAAKKVEAKGVGKSPPKATPKIEKPATPAPTTTGPNKFEDPVSEPKSK